MSYILEALRKADQERSAGSVPDLEADHESSHENGRSYRWAWLLGAILVVNGLLLAGLLLRGDGGEPAPVASIDPVPAAPARERAAPPPAVSTARPAPKVATGKPVTAAPAVRPVKPVTATAPVSGTPAATMPLSAPASPTEARPVAAPVAVPVTREPVAVAPSPVTPTPASPRTQLASAPPVLEPAEDSGVPFWDQLSLEYRSGFELPRLDVHVYDNDPQRRFLLIELKKYREGDTLANGVLIEEIVPEGVRMFFRGTRFIYRK